MAVAALVLGILAFLTGWLLIGILFGLIAVILGIVGISKSRQPNTGGKGLAVTGLILGALGIASGILVLVAGASLLRDAEFLDFLEGVTSQQSVFDLAVGDCFDDPDTSGQIGSVQSVGCDQPHDNEVFALITHPGTGDYPGEDEITSFGSQQCQGAAFVNYVGSDYPSSRYFVTTLYPTAESWADGDREIVCALFVPDETLTGSARGAGD